MTTTTTKIDRIDARKIGDPHSSAETVWATQVQDAYLAMVDGGGCYSDWTDAVKASAPVTEDEADVLSACLDATADGSAYCAEDFDAPEWLDLSDVAGPDQVWKRTWTTVMRRAEKRIESILAYLA